MVSQPTAADSIVQALDAVQRAMVQLGKLEYETSCKTLELSSLKSIEASLKAPFVLLVACEKFYQQLTFARDLSETDNLRRSYGDILGDVDTLHGILLQEISGRKGALAKLLTLSTSAVTTASHKKDKKEKKELRRRMKNDAKRVSANRERLEEACTFFEHACTFIAARLIMIKVMNTFCDAHFRPLGDAQFCRTTVMPMLSRARLLADSIFAPALQDLRDGIMFESHILFQLMECHTYVFECRYDRTVATVFGLKRALASRRIGKASALPSFTAPVPAGGATPLSQETNTDKGSGNSKSKSKSKSTDKGKEDEKEQDKEKEREKDKEVDQEKEKMCDGTSLSSPHMRFLESLLQRERQVAALIFTEVENEIFSSLRGGPHQQQQHMSRERWPNIAAGLGIGMERRPSLLPPPVPSNPNAKSSFLHGIPSLDLIEQSGLVAACREAMATIGVLMIRCEDVSQPTSTGALTSGGLGFRQAYTCPPTHLWHFTHADAEKASEQVTRRLGQDFPPSCGGRGGDEEATAGSVLSPQWPPLFYRMFQPRLLSGELPLGEHLNMDVHEFLHNHKDEIEKLINVVLRNQDGVVDDTETNADSIAVNDSSIATAPVPDALGEAGDRVASLEEKANGDAEVDAEQSNGTTVSIEDFWHTCGDQMTRVHLRRVVRSAANIAEQERASPSAGSVVDKAGDGTMQSEAATAGATNSAGSISAATDDAPATDSHSPDKTGQSAEESAPRESQSFPGDSFDGKEKGVLELDGESVSLGPDEQVQAADETTDTMYACVNLGSGNQLVFFGQFIPQLEHSHSVGDPKLVAMNLVVPLVALGSALHGVDVMARLGT